MPVTEFGRKYYRRRALRESRDRLLGRQPHRWLAWLHERRLKRIISELDKMKPYFDEREIQRQHILKTLKPIP